MKARMLGVFVIAGLGIGTYLSLAKKEEPQPQPQVAAAPTPPAAPTAPAMLPGVIDVTDLDPLLDPPAKAAIGIPFDADPPAAPAAAPPPAFIPLANEDAPVSVAPMPREAAAPVPFPTWGVSGIRFIF